MIGSPATRGAAQPADQSGLPICVGRELRHQPVALAGEVVNAGGERSRLCERPVAPLLGDLRRLLRGKTCLAVVGGVALGEVLGGHRLDGRDPG